MNQRRFDSTIFNKSPIVEESIVTATPFDKTKPYLLQGIAELQELKDQVDYFQVGQ